MHHNIKWSVKQLLIIAKELRQFDTMSTQKNCTVFTFANINQAPYEEPAEISNAISIEEERTHSDEQLGPGEIRKNFPKRRDACTNIFDFYDPSQK